MFVPEWREARGGPDGARGDALAVPRGPRSARRARRRRPAVLAEDTAARLARHRGPRRRHARELAPPQPRRQARALHEGRHRSREGPEALAELPKGCVVASRTFDYELLRWEIEHFREWGLDARGKALAEADAARFDAIADRLAQRIADLPRGFVHRDYQSRNLMVVDDGKLRLVLDRLPGRAPRAARLRPRRAAQRQLPGVRSRLRRGAPRRVRRGRRPRPRRRARELTGEFDLVTVQRKLKDAGRFVFIDRTKKNNRRSCAS